MRVSTLFRSATVHGIGLTLVSLALRCWPAPAHAAVISLGSATEFSLLTVPGNTTINFSLGTVNGDVGIGALGRYGNAQPTTTNGTAYVATSSSQVAAPGRVIGGIVVDPAKVNQAIADATAGNLAAAAEPPTQPAFGNITGPTTITGAGPGSQNVININGNVSLGGSDSITLNGTADEVFILNIFGDFDLTGSGGIKVNAPVIPEHVLINFVGTNPSSISANINNVIQGTILAPQRVINFHSVSGAIYGGNAGNPGITLSSGATLDFAGFVPIPEPGTAALALLGVFGLTARRRRGL